MNALRKPAALVILVTLIAAPLAAASASAPMHVSVVVVARAVVTVSAAPTVEVTASDLARGYVDVTTPIVLQGRTNSRHGYMLQAEKLSDEFSTITLQLPDATMTIASHESWIQRPYVPGGEVLPTTARLFLAPGATTGTHALPVSFTATPL